MNIWRLPRGLRTPLLSGGRLRWQSVERERGNQSKTLLLAKIVTRGMGEACILVFNYGKLAARHHKKSVPCVDRNIMYPAWGKPSTADAFRFLSLTSKQNATTAAQQNKNFIGL